ncbi:conserved hypothetical protein, putative partial [Cupriavidus taiwanensis]|uniref:Uncharacterized protein n=3 Tax=Cupriavidus TaxID=106589 RepID=A0A375F7N8_9BURK|nr:conserved hypothetical protein, putative partial [Cupriavidus taiwanensis LMG 19424]SOY74380.1 conserved hypothetical protein, putative partial [Cupriavidus taiwanensis]SOZ40425.1 conserved hypothetical protein, putative partial [Cupriavidus neocaledonicus]SOY74383.1 conserved hypothetical protein, putative partial [Cupriavidus taiwanensis]SOY74384.1 conserved hypothetical protein, putative partial [Cupriavidus taiwanensis]
MKEIHYRPYRFTIRLYPDDALCTVGFQLQELTLFFNIVDQVRALARTDNAVDATDTLRCCALIECYLATCYALNRNFLTVPTSDQFAAFLTNVVANHIPG